MFLETLESRLLMSVSPVNAQIQADRAQIHADLVKFAADVKAKTVTMLADIKALQADDIRHNTTLAPLFKTLRTDISKMWTQLASDRLDQRSNVLKDEGVIVADLKQILADKGNKTALKADRAKLLADRIQLRKDEIAGLTARLNTRQSAYNGIVADLTAIKTAVEADATASPKLLADVQKFVADRTATLTTITADLTALKADRVQLVADLTALQNQ